MMFDVNVLSPYYDLLVDKHVAIGNMYRIRDELKHVDAYSCIVFDNLLLYNKYILKPSTKLKITACNSLTAVAAPPLLSQYHLADEWPNYTNSILQYVVTAAPIDAVEQLQLPVLFLASHPELPKYICTLQFSAGTKGLSTPPPNTHIDSLQSFLAVYINHWVSFNSLTATIAQSIAKSFPITMEVTAVGPTIGLCNIC